MRMPKYPSPVMLVIWAALCLVGLIALAFANISMALLSFATLVLSLIPLFMAHFLSVKLPVPFVLATTIFVFSTIFLGEVLNFYERLWWWDVVLHGTSALGIGMVGFLFLFMLFEGDRFAAPPSAIAFLTFCLAMTVGVIWEVFEFLMDYFFGLNMQKSGLGDTMGDIMINAIGSALAALAGYLLLVRDSAGILGRGLSQFIELNQRLYRKAKKRLRK